MNAITANIARIAAAAGLLAATLGTAHATADWQAAAATCVPDSKATINYELTGKPAAWVSLTGAAVKTDGAKIVYFCNVLSPEDVNPVPSWTTLKLQFGNTYANEVQAVLYSKNKATGTVATVVGVTSFVSPGSVAVNSAGLPAPLNFATNAYHIVLTVSSYQGSQARGHMVWLTND